MANMSSTMLLMLVAGLIACTAARTLTLEKVSVSLSEDSEDKDFDIPKIVKSLLSESLDLEGSDLSRFEGCTAPSCCITEYNHKVCFKATLNGKVIHVELELDGSPVISTDITGPSPPEACFKPPTKYLTKACLIVKNVNIADLSGCVSVMGEASGFQKTFEIGCFKLNGAETIQEKKPTDDVIELPAGSVLKFRRTEPNSL